MDSFHDYVKIAELNQVSPLLNQWFVGGFMYGRRSQDDDLVRAFRLFADFFGESERAMTLFRVEPHERSTSTLLETHLQPISSWCKTDVAARRFYHAVSLDKNSPVSMKSHAIVRSTFEPQQIMLDAEKVLPKLDELLEGMQQRDDFPYRLANVYNNLKWHEGQKEVVVHAPGPREVRIVQWMP